MLLFYIFFKISLNIGKTGVLFYDIISLLSNNHGIGFLKDFLFNCDLIIFVVCFNYKLKKFSLTIVRINSGIENKSSIVIKVSDSLIFNAFLFEYETSRKPRLLTKSTSLKSSFNILNFME